ncbi:hypothetical protein OENI_20222 [Oenococcus oeni]|nr:hypothetical protein OENI_150021 [Oenococcus oeni]SYW18152.1 hypothetical protein OENI_20222 [Oenococcus oeni]
MIVQLLDRLAFKPYPMFSIFYKLYLLNDYALIVCLLRKVMKNYILLYRNL